MIAAAASSRGTSRRPARSLAVVRSRARRRARGAGAGLQRGRRRERHRRLGLGLPNDDGHLGRCSSLTAAGSSSVSPCTGAGAAGSGAAGASAGGAVTASAGTPADCLCRWRQDFLCPPRCSPRPRRARRPPRPAPRAPARAAREAAARPRLRSSASTARAAGETAGPPKLSEPNAEPLSAALSALDRLHRAVERPRGAVPGSARTVSFALAKRSGARICVLRR